MYLTGLELSIHAGTRGRTPLTDGLLKLPAESRQEFSNRRESRHVGHFDGLVVEVQPQTPPKSHYLGTCRT